MPGWITVSWNAPAVDDRMVRTVASCNQQPTLADCNIVTSLNRAPRTLSPSPAYAPMYFFGFWGLNMYLVSGDMPSQYAIWVIMASRELPAAL